MCHETWIAGRGVTFKATTCDCAFLTTVAGIPIQGGQAYGVAKVWDYSSVVKVDDAFRMTTFSRDAASVTTATFTRANGEYARTESAECPVQPGTPTTTMPPTPTYKCFSLSGFYSCVEHDGPDGSPSKEDCSRTCEPPQLYKCTAHECEVVTSGSSGLSLEECKRVCPPEN